MLLRLSAKAGLRDGHSVLRLPSLRKGDQPHAAGGRLHLARILETHGIRSLLINASAFILLIRRSRRYAQRFRGGSPNEGQSARMLRNSREALTQTRKAVTARALIEATRR